MDLAVNNVIDDISLPCEEVFNVTLKCLGLSSVSSMDTKIKLFELSKASLKLMKISSTCETKSLFLALL